MLFRLRNCVKRTVFRLKYKTILELIKFPMAQLERNRYNGYDTSDCVRTCSFVLFYYSNNCVFANGHAHAMCQMSEKLQI